jgi:hypothetical protein
MKKIFYTLLFLTSLFSQKTSQNGLELDKLVDFSISIGQLNEVAEDIGLSKRKILETVQLKLKENKTPANKNKKAYLLINIDCLPINYSDGRSTGMYVYNIQTNFIRPVTFKKREDLYAFSEASVWNNYSSGFTNNTYTIINDLLDMIDKFSSDLKSAN